MWRNLWERAAVLLSLLAPGTTAATAYGSIVQQIEQQPTTQSISWEHRVAEGGDYQIGQAWVHMVEGDALRVEVAVNGTPVRTHDFERGAKVEPYDAPLFRFPMRLEQLAKGDVVRVSCKPSSKTEYELAYKLAFGTPIFEEARVFDLKRFGAKADGKHNDLPALWKATAAAVKAGGGIIRFEKDETYRLRLERPETVKEKQYVFQLDGQKNIKFEGNGGIWSFAAAPTAMWARSVAAYSRRAFTGISFPPLVGEFMPYWQSHVDIDTLQSLL